MKEVVLLIMTQGFVQRLGAVEILFMNHSKKLLPLAASIKLFNKNTKK